MKKLVIAIDGPAASGKSTTSKLVAERLGYLYIDSGAMYRAIALKVIRNKIGLFVGDEIGNLAEQSKINLERISGKLVVMLDGEDVSNEIRSSEISNAASSVSAVDKVRKVLVAQQRLMGEKGGVVMDGRDIGTVVFPDADLKIFMIADVKERAIRRQKDLEKLGKKVALDDLIAEIAIRDKNDSGRLISPLRKAEDAIELDTTSLTIDEQVNFIVNKAIEKMSDNEG